MRKVIVYIRRKLRVIFGFYYRFVDIRRLNNKNFVIVSNDCWGGAVYQWYRKPYNTPFVGTFIYAPCYLKLLSDFIAYMQKPLTFVDVSRYPDVPVTYPVALLGDIEIHFMHYKTAEEARLKWARRVERMFAEKNFDNYFFKFSDGGHACHEHFEKFHSLPFKNKLSFSVAHPGSFKHENNIQIVESYGGQNERVPNGVKLFKLTFIYFDLNQWLRGL